jgi:hypothetical protein
MCTLVRFIHFINIISWGLEAAAVFCLSTDRSVCLLHGYKVLHPKKRATEDLDWENPKDSLVCYFPFRGEIGL